MKKNKRVAIIQSNYIPWTGYFEIIKKVDEFIFLDNVQYTRRDWRNRNLILLKNSKKWLSIPVKSKGNYRANINEIEISDLKWKDKHLNYIKEAYKKSEFFNSIFPTIEKIYYNNNSKKLSQINQNIIKGLSKCFNFKTRFNDANNIVSKSEINPSERLLEICIASKAKTYLAGPNSLNYLDMKIFQKKKFKCRNI